MEEQADRDTHAAFMNALYEPGNLLLAGPLGGSGDILLVMRIFEPDDVTGVLANDPRTRSRLLTISRVAPWTLRLGSLEKQ
jgi:uncharacterized protein YciI